MELGPHAHIDVTIAVWHAVRDCRRREDDGRARYGLVLIEGESILPTLDRLNMRAPAAQKAARSASQSV